MYSACLFNSFSGFLFKVKFLLSVDVTVRLLRLVLDLYKSSMIKAFLVLPEKYLPEAKIE